MEPAFSAGDFRTLTALTLTGSWSNTLLFTAEVVVCIIYTRHWKLEQAYKHVVHAMLLNDSIASLTNYATVFLIFVYFDDVPWPVAMGFVANANSAFIGQAFLIFLHKEITKNRLVSGFFMLISVAQLAASVVAAIHFAHPSLVTVQDIIPTKVVAVLGAVLNVLITLNYLWATWDKTPPGSQTPRWRTIGLHYLCSGAAVATITVAAMILILDARSGPAASFVFTFMARFYSFGVLANLIIRCPSSSPPEVVDFRRGGYRQSSVMAGNVTFSRTHSSHSAHDTQWQSVPDGVDGIDESHGKPEASGSTE